MELNELFIGLSIALAGVFIVILSWMLMKRGRRSADATEMASETHDIIRHTNTTDKAEQHIAVFTHDDNRYINDYQPCPVVMDERMGKRRRIAH